MTTAASAADDPNSRVTPWFFWPGCAALTAIYLVVALSRISDLALIDPDEPRYAGAGRTMAQSWQGRSLLVPQFNGAPRINKPPLFYWLVALSDTLAGRATEASARAPSVVMGLLMLWGTIWLGWRVFGASAGLLAGLVLAATPLFMGLSRCCITDMTLSTFMAGALAWLLLGMCGFAPPGRAGWIAAVLLGFAVLTKATAALAVLLVVVIARALSLPKEARPSSARWIPWVMAGALMLSAAAMQLEVLGKKTQIAKHKADAVARAELDDPAEFSPDEGTNIWEKLDAVVNALSLVLCGVLVAILIGMAYRAERRAPALPPAWKMGLLFAIMMGLWWYGLLILDQGAKRFLALLDFEVKQRLTGTVHRESVHYYLLLLPAVAFPWSFGLPGALASAWPNDGTPQGGSGQQRADAFLLAWLAGIVLFFSIPGAKLATYVLPAMPAVALLTARFFMKLWHERHAVGRPRLAAVQAIALAVALALLLFPIYMRWLPEQVPAFVSEILGSESKALLFAFACGATLVFSVPWLLALRGRARWAPLALGGGAFALVLLAVRPAIERLNHRSTKSVCLQTRDNLAGCTRFVSLGVAPESLSYYLEHSVEELRLKHAAPTQTGIDFVLKILGDTEPTAIFIEKRYYPRIFGKAEAKSLTPEDMQKRLPPNLTYVFSNQNMLVVRNQPAR